MIEKHLNDDEGLLEFTSFSRDQKPFFERYLTIRAKLIVKIPVIIRNEAASEYHIQVSESDSDLICFSA